MLEFVLSIVRWLWDLRGKKPDDHSPRVQVRASGNARVTVHFAADSTRPRE